jgi:hypothetical protein
LAGLSFQDLLHGTQFNTDQADKNLKEGDHQRSSASFQVCNGLQKSRVIGRIAVVDFPRYRVESRK